MLLKLCKHTAGLAGYVEYPTQELVSGLLPLTDIASMASNLSTICVKPGQGLFNTTMTVRDSMVRRANEPVALLNGSWACDDVQDGCMCRTSAAARSVSGGTQSASSRNTSDEHKWNQGVQAEHTSIKLCLVVELCCCKLKAFDIIYYIFST